MKAVASTDHDDLPEPIATQQISKEMIAEVASYKAEQRGFIPGFEMQDWIKAETELGTQLSKI